MRAFMFRMSSQRAMASTKNATKPPIPGETAVLGVFTRVLPSVVGELEACLGREGVSTGDVTQAGEEVVLDRLDRDVRQRHFVLLGRPHALLDSRGTRKKVPSGSIWVACDSRAWSRWS